jgi:hypothetical protein
MDLTKFSFPELTVADIMLPTIDYDYRLFEEAKRRGFYKSKSLFNLIFPVMDTMDCKKLYRDNLEIDFIKKGCSYCLAMFSGKAIDYYEKEAVAALIASELLDKEKLESYLMPDFLNNMGITTQK